MDEIKKPIDEIKKPIKKTLFACLAISIGILCVIAFLCTGYFIYAKGRLAFFIVLLIFCISGVIFSVLGFEFNKRRNFLMCNIGLILSLFIVVSVMFEIFYTYIF